MFNLMKTAILMAAITALFMAIGSLLGGQTGMLIALVVAVGMNFFSYWFSDKLVLKMYNAQEVDERSAPQFYNMVTGAGRARPAADAQGLPDRGGRPRTRSPPAATRSMPRSPRPPASCACCPSANCAA